jgi:hypothetical protein
VAAVLSARPKPPEPRRRWLARLGRWILGITAVATLACEALYLVVMNVFLSTPLFEKVVNATPFIVDVHYVRGWSFFPTRIHAKGLSIRGTDSNIEWILRFDEVQFDCSLLGLATQTFHVTRARGSGITFRVRFKVASPAATPERVSRLPPIDSLGPVGFIPSEPPSPAEWNDRAWHLWTVRIDDAIAEHVREIWIEDGRFQGDARITGGFLLKPMRAAYVGPAHVDVRSGRVSWDARTVAEPLAAKFDFELSLFDPRHSSGADLLPRISLSLDARTEVPDLAGLSLSLPDSGQIRGKVEIPRLAIRIVKGVVRDESHVDAHGAMVEVTTASHDISGRVDLAADVLSGRLLVQASLEHVDVDSLLAAPRIAVVADSAALDLLDPVADLHGVLDLPDAEVPQASRLMSVLPGGSPVRISRGSLRASLHAEAWRSDQRVRANARVQAKDMDVFAGRLGFRGDADLESSVGAFQVDTRRATELRVGIAVPEGRVAPEAFPDEPFVRVSGFRARAEAAEVERDHALRSLRASMAVDDAEWFDTVSARAALGLALEVRLVSRRARFGGAADLLVDGDRASGTFDARAPGLGLEYAGRRLGLDVTAHGRAHATNWRSGTFSLDEARVVGTHLALSDATSLPAISIARFSMSASSPRLVLADPLARLDLVGAIDGGRMVSPSALGDLFPAGRIAPDSKAGATFDGDVALQVTGHVARGAGSVSARGVGVSGKKIRVAGDVRAVVTIKRWDFTGGTLAGDVALRAQDATGRFGPSAGPPDFVADRIDVRASVAALDLVHPSMRELDYGVRVGHAALDDARALNTFLPSPEIIAIESGRALVSADIGTSGPARAAGGHIDVSLIDAGIRLHKTHLAGNLAVVVQANRFDPELAAVDVEGSHVAMRNVHVTGSSTDTSQWIGDLVFRSGTLALAPIPRLEGEITIDALDASPLLGVLFRDSLPGVVANLLHMPNLIAVTHLVVEPDRLAVSDLFARGGDLALRGTYVLREGDRRAAFVLEKGPWSVGISLDDGGSRVRLFGLDGWYKDRSREALAPRW